MSVKDGDGTTSQDGKAYELQIYPRLSLETASCCTLRVTKEATAASVIRDAAATLGLDASKLYVLAEVKECGGEEWVLESTDLPVHRVLLWPRKAQEQHSQKEGFYFLLQERNHDGSIRYVHLPAVGNEQESKRLVARGFLPPQQEDFEDLCNLPILSEDSILDNLRIRFQKNKIYTYAGSILIAINPFKFLPIYNPKYVKMYENHQLGKLEPHIFAIADVAYYAMLRKHVNQCIVISGESGSGKTQSTNFLIHCLTALSQKGYASGVERTILGAGPVLEAFGNAKTAHNNNSSRFGKFIQVNYLESGVVRGAVVEKYLLEKSRLVSREKNERNYHVFYYLLVGASEDERREFRLLQPEEYFYLKQQNFTIEDADDLRHDFERLQQAMEMVGFLPTTKRQIFSVLSAILYLGNVTYSQKSSGREEGLDVGPPEVLSTLSDLLKVKEELLVEALTKRKTVTVNDKLILPYSHSQAITARDSMAKSLYSALFDWIVLRINHALLNKRDMEESVSCLSIGVLDIFGFEDFETNSFEQFCINYANEQLQYYFNQHIFKLEQEEYQAEGITWHNIDYTDNVGCIHLISKKPTGLLYLLDEESNFPHATDKTLLAKFKQQHQQRGVGGDFREKNTDHMRPDIVALLRSSDRAYVRQLIGMDPLAMFRWGILRATVRALAAFNESGRRWAAKTAVSPNLILILSTYGVVLHPSHIQRVFSFIRFIKERYSFTILSKNSRAPGGVPWAELKSHEHLRIDYFPCRHVSMAFMWQNKVSLCERLTFCFCVFGQNLLDSRSLKFVVGLHDRTTKSLLHLHKKKRPPSISAQFQTSLSKLLETLGKAEPFFIRCLRSNAEKKEMCFDEALVVQQLRYTGMLETVRIRRSGYGAKYTFQEFTEQFRVLLPKKAKSLEDISSLLHRLGFDHTTYQIGKTKVYLKELERQKLQDILHKDVMRKIIFLQCWFRAKMQRMEFIRMREAAILIQVCQNWFCVWRSWRSYRKEKFYQAAVLIQSAWRGSKQRAEYRKTQASNPLDHVFTHYQVNIMQSCDQCTSYIWGMEKCDDEPGSQHFGVRVCHLVNNKTPVPIVLEIMLEHVEMNGLYTEGIYRKSGSANRMKELHQLLEAENVCLEDYPIHAVTGLVKQWLRELPEPLMTFTHYNDFLRAIELPEKQEQLQAIYKVLEQLPTANFNTLERLVFHLVRVAKEEKSNRMTPNSLAIVFAPCILRCPDSADPLMSMKDVARTTTCVEMLLNEQIRRYNERMEEIEQLEYAEALAVNQLKLKRQNTVREKPASDLCAVPENEPLDSDTEAERSLMERIKSIKQEKYVNVEEISQDLACRLPELEQPGSDQENLDSEASVSSESLLDERAVCSDTEGQY
uniref:Myosin IXB n=1 Tax=Sinocyclocheilus rhinocerous TaxID=307959 RepID=A0A673M8J4_9TELE